MGFNFNPLSWGTELAKEAWSALPGTAPYDARNPNNPYYAEKKTVQIPGRAITPSEAQYMGVTAGASTPNTQTANVPNNPTPSSDPYAAQRAAQARQRQSEMDLVRRAFGTKRAGFQSQLGTLDTQRQAGETNVNNQYNTQRGTIDTQRLQGIRDLSNSQQQVEAGRERGLKALRDQLEQRAMSYANQLGAYGAGDSSASMLVNTALSGQSARERGDLLTNTSDQLTAIDTQRQDLETSYNQNISALDDWKSTSLSDLAQKYLAQKQQIQAAMADADYQEAAQLAQYDASLTQSAINQLSNLENIYNQQAAELNKMYSTMVAPREYAIPENLRQYDVRPIEAGRLRGLEMPMAVNPESQIQAILRKREEDQLSQAPIGY